jgi:hypothetical protein
MNWKSTFRTVEQQLLDTLALDLRDLLRFSRQDGCQRPKRQRGGRSDLPKTWR